MPSVNIDDTDILSFDENWDCRPSGKRASGRAVRVWVNGNLQRLSNQQIVAEQITTTGVPQTLPDIF